MTDSSNLGIPNGHALTSDMLYGLKPSAPKSRSYRVSQAPSNGSVFAPGGQIQIDLPTGRPGTYFDGTQSYLKFAVQVSSNAASTAWVSNTAYSFLQRFDLYHGSNQLETYSNYGQLCNLLLDCTTSRGDKTGLGAMMGINANNIQSIGSATTQYSQTNLVVQPGDRSGLPLTTSTTIGTSIAYPFALPLCSAVIGPNCPKMLPIGRMGGAPIHMEITLAANDDALFYQTTCAGCLYQIVNVEFVATYVEILDGNFIDNSSEPTYICSTTYRDTSIPIPSATPTGDWTVMLPFRCSSLKAVYGMFLNNSAAVQGANATACYRKTSTVNPNFSQYYFRVGTSQIPNKPVTIINGNLCGAGSEAFAELQKSFHALVSTASNAAIDWNEYNVALSANKALTAPFQLTAVRTSASSQADCENAFYIGQELESFSNRTDSILSGINTLNNQVYFTGTIYTSTPSAVTALFWGQMDTVLIIENGIMSARF